MIQKKLIECLLAIEETRNFTRAANKLYISQSALSRMVIELERELGVQLFDRTKSPIGLTYCGERYLGACRSVLKINNSVENEITGIIAGNRGRIVLGLSSFMSRCISHIIVPEFRKAYPNVELRLVEMSSPKLEGLVLSGGADVALVNSFGNPDLAFTHIMEEAVYLAVPPAFAEERALHQGFNDVQVDINELREYPFVLLKEGHGLRNYADALFQRYNFRPIIGCETESFDVSYNMVNAGMGFAFVSEISLKYNKHSICCCRIKDMPLYRSINLCMDRGIYHLKAMECLVDIISSAFRDIWREGPPGNFPSVISDSNSRI